MTLTTRFGRRGGVTGKGFVPGQVNNPHGRPRDLIGFRERCRERTLEVVEILECVFFTGHWPNRTKFVSDAVRMSAGAMLVSNGWGTPPNSTDIRITMPQLSPQLINRQMTATQAAELYKQTLRVGHFDDSGADQPLFCHHRARARFAGDSCDRDRLGQRPNATSTPGNLPAPERIHAEGEPRDWADAAGIPADAPQRPVDTSDASGPAEDAPKAQDEPPRPPKND
jgi:hypothetical protein